MTKTEKDKQTVKGKRGRRAWEEIGSYEKNKCKLTVLRKGVRK